MPDAEGYVHIYNEDGERVRAEFPDGGVWHYKSGELTCVEWPNGHVSYYENDVRVREEFPDGRVHHYGGVMGNE